MNEHDAEHTERPLAPLLAELKQITGRSHSADPQVVALIGSERSKVSAAIAWCFRHDSQ